MATASDIASAVREALDRSYEDALLAVQPFYADEIEMRHVPPNPADGPRSAAALRADSPVELAAVRGVMPDVHYDAVVTSTDDAVVVDGKLCGTLPGGDAYVQELQMTYDVDDGKVVRFTSAYDPASIAPLVPHIMAAFEQAGRAPGEPAT